jgi:CheY-like chemotaxis protein
VRSVLGRLLGQWGFTVVEADNGKSALQVARKHQNALSLLYFPECPRSLHDGKMSTLFSTGYRIQESTYCSSCLIQMPCSILLPGSSSPA